MPPTNPEKPLVKTTPDLSDGFFLAAVRKGREQGWDPRNWLAVSAYEADGVRARAENPAGAYGLIQFTEAARGGIGWKGPLSGIAALSAEDQIPLVYAYYKPHAPFRSPGEVYGFTFVPAWKRNPNANLVYADPNARPANEPPWQASWGSEGNTYAQNRSLDVNKDGKISIGDLTATTERATKAMGARWTEILARLAWAEKQVQTADGGGPSYAPIIIAGVALVVVASLFHVGRS